MVLRNKGPKLGCLFVPLMLPSYKKTCSVSNAVVVTYCRQWKVLTNFPFIDKKIPFPGLSRPHCSAHLGEISYPTDQVPLFIRSPRRMFFKIAFRWQNAKCGKLPICAHKSSYQATILIQAFPSIGMIKCSHPLSKCWRMPRPVHVLICAYVCTKAAIRQPGLLSMLSRQLAWSRVPIPLSRAGVCRVLFMYLSAHMFVTKQQSGNPDLSMLSRQLAWSRVPIPYHVLAHAASCSCTYLRKC